MNYEYKCNACDNVQIIVRSMRDPEGEYDCDKCNTRLTRVYTAAPVKFTGTGFYSTGG